MDFNTLSSIVELYSHIITYEDPLSLADPGEGPPGAAPPLNPPQSYDCAVLKMLKSLNVFRSLFNNKSEKMSLFLKSIHAKVTI